MKIIPLALLVVSFAIAGTAFAQTQTEEPKEASQAESVSDATEDKKIVKAKIDDVAWIAGSWHGEAMGGKFEETWNAPFGGTIMGMFKFVKDGEVVFYELLTIVEEEESLLLRLKHFHKNLAGWEEKDKTIEFPLLSHSKTEAVFDGLKFTKVDDDSMSIVVHIDEGGKVNELKFDCKRR